MGVLVKDTSLAYIVGVAEFTFVASQVNSREQVCPMKVFGCHRLSGVMQLGAMGGKTAAGKAFASLAVWSFCRSV